MGKITVISPYGINSLSGHSLVDDEYYFRFLVDSGARFTYYAARYSMERMRERVPHGSHYQLRVLGEDPFHLEAGERVVFVGYRESTVIKFAVRYGWLRPRLTLIATNNFSRGRIDRYDRALGLFFRFVSPLIERIVVHTKFELELLREVRESSAQKAFIKRHHLMSPVSMAAEEHDPPVIAYFGPPKDDKPIDPVARLILADKRRRFRFRLYNVDPDLLAGHGIDASSHGGVELFQGWQDDAGHSESIAGATLLLLSHTRAFEGKLSGNLCDCIAAGIPYIARCMEPISSYENTYGQMGFTYDFEDSGWAEQFIADFDASRIADLRRRISKMAEDHQPDRIASDLAVCFLGESRGSTSRAEF